MCIRDSLIDAVGQLGDNDPLTAVLHLFNLGAGAHGDLSASCRIGRADSAAAHDNAAGREIRAGQMGHQLLDGGIGVIDQRADRIDHQMCIRDR